MPNLVKLTKKQRRAEKQMQKLLFGQYLPNIKKCTKKTRNMELQLLQYTMN